MPGLLPGGRSADEPSQEGRRSHIHMSRHIAVDVIIPEKFRRRNVDCCIRLDSTKLLADGYELFLSDADVILAEVELPLKHIENVQLIYRPQLVLYNRPKASELE